MDDAPKNKPKRIPFTPAMSAALRAQAQRTGVSAFALLKEHLPPQNGITQAQLYRWMDGAAKTICARRYRLLLETWTKLPERGDFLVAAAPEILALLRGERNRTGTGIAKLLSGRADVPEGLSAKALENFYHGALRETRREYIDYALELWRALPDRETVPLTPEILSSLRGHVARTGRGPHAILRGARGKPDRLTGALVSAWLAGERVTARRDHLDYVLKLYEQPQARLRITAGIKAEIGRHIRRTGVTWEALARSAGIECGGCLPAGQNWPPRYMPEEELRFFLTRWRALPDRRGGRGAK